MGNNLPAGALAASRPGLVIDGRNDTGLEGSLLELTVHQSAEGLSRCEAAFNNWGATSSGTGFLHFDRSQFDFGKAFQVQLGRESIFDGHLTAIAGSFPPWGPSSLRIHAEDRLQDLRMTRRTRCFDNSSDSDAIGRIVRDHGLTPRCDLSGPPHRVLAQVNQSDLAFIRERARANGAAVWLDGNEVHVVPRQASGQSRLTLVHGGRLREFSVAADVAGQATRFVVAGWDVAAKQALEGRADAAAISNELNGGESGAALLGQAFGERVQTWGHGLPTDSGQARTLAEAAFRDQARRFVCGRGVADADAALQVGASVELQGLGPLFSGRYWVAETCLRFDAVQGLRVEFVVERPGLGRVDAGSP